MIRMELSLAAREIFNRREHLCYTPESSNELGTKHLISANPLSLFKGKKQQKKYNNSYYFFVRDF